MRFWSYDNNRKKKKKLFSLLKENNSQLSFLFSRPSVSLQIIRSSLLAYINMENIKEKMPGSGYCFGVIKKVLFAAFPKKLPSTLVKANL